MPRVKAKAVRRTNESSEVAPSPAKRPRRSAGGLKRKILASAPTELHLLGPLCLPWIEPPDPPSASRIQITEQFDGSFQVLIDGSPVVCPDHIAELLKKNMQSSQLVLENVNAEEVSINIGLKSLPIPHMRFWAEPITGKDYSEFEEYSKAPDTAWVQFFKELETIQRSRVSLDRDFQHPDLQPTLRGYQSAAVLWMVDRENNPKDLDLSWVPQVADELKTRNGDVLLYNKYSKVVYNNVPRTPICSGGILADEMGLGKTVITLALLLNNTRTDLESLSWEMVVSEVADTSSRRSHVSTRELNQEDCLDAKEQLQVVAPKQGKGVLKAHLNAWYESMLAEVSVRRSISSPVRKVAFKCTCGEDVDRIPRNAVKCGCCGLRQHPSCCGHEADAVYVCPSCWRLQAPVPSRATLVVAPPAIYAQWASEITRHAPTLKLLQYSGCRDSFVQPSHMADFDVVLTTYTVLRAETLYTGETSERCLRNEGRFLKSSSPLEKVNWWRIVCDEAQMVESDVSQARVMTQKLTASHRWCVTGTPIQKGVADLFYLTSFMGLGVFDDKNTWTDFLLKPYLAGCKEPLHTVLSQVFWRSTKEEVSSELCLPEQTFQRHLLKFTAIEETFYMQLHSACASKFAESIRKSGYDANTPVESLDKASFKRLLTPLLNLRQACTHAQMVSGITINSASGAANLAELLQYLCKKTKQECEEALRRHVAALNGLAGLHCLELNWPAAVESYRAVLRLAEEFNEEVHVDTLQRIHALTNVALVLKDEPVGVPPTLRDDNLFEDAKKLEKKYLSKPEDAFSSSLVQAKTSSQEVKALSKEFESSPGAWWVPVTLALNDHEHELVDKLNEVLHSNDPLEKAAAKSFLSKVSTLRGAEITIKQWWTAVEKHHKSVTNSIEVLTDTPCSILVEQALNCHLRAIEQKDKCDLCQVEKKLLDLECELFATTRKKMTKRAKVLDGAETKGSWKPHSAERTLFTVFSFARGKCSLEPWCLRDGRKHQKLLEAMKKEFKHVRAAWTALNHRVHAEDELTMAKLRLRFAEPWEARQRPDILALSTPAKAETQNLVPPAEVPIMLRELADDRDASLSDFRKKHGRMLYLQNLGKDRNCTPEPCPICKNTLDKQWSVLHCGHCFCIDCLRMIHSGAAKRVKCPVCREFTDSSDIGFVDTTSSGAVNDLDVKGDYSTKVDNIVRQVLKLLQDDATVKILIFSIWTGGLKILGQALTSNDVKYLSLPSGNHQAVIENFRDLDGGVSVLLLPLAWGSKGLNLIEATHVFLVEPILNPAEELQAIGRVHRIGQTKPTFVHRFIIKGTVEEKIFEAVSEADDSWSTQKSSLGDLQKLFVIPSRQPQ